MSTVKIHQTCPCGAEFDVDAEAQSTAHRMLTEFIDAHDNCLAKPIEHHTHVTEEKIHWQHYSVGDKISFCGPGMPPKEFVIVAASGWRGGMENEHQCYSVEFHPEAMDPK